MIARLRQTWERATPQVRRPFYVGLAVAAVLAVLVGLGIANTESFLRLPSQFEGVATSQAIWGLKPSNLLMVLPLGAFLVVLARSFIGLKAFGLFTPMLIALAFLQIGPVMGPIVLCSSVLVGMIVTPSLLKLRMTRVGFLGVLISLIVLVLVALQLLLDTRLQVDAFPVIVCALCVERWWKQWGKDGAKASAKMALNTFILAVVIEFVMVSDFAMAFIEWSPLVMPAFAAAAIGVLGRYRGLRLSEIHRFAPIWLERRRKARALVLPDGVTVERRRGLADTRRPPSQVPSQVPSLAPSQAPARKEPTDPVTLAARECAPPLSGMWVINSRADLKRFARRRVPQATGPVVPDRDAQFEPLPAPSGAPAPRRRPPIHNAWVIRKVEDV